MLNLGMHSIPAPHFPAGWKARQRGGHRNSLQERRAASTTWCVGLEDWRALDDSGKGTSGFFKRKAGEGRADIKNACHFPIIFVWIC